MGVWGAGVFSDDTAADVRDDYRALLQKGVEDAEATRQVLEQWTNAVDDPDETPVVWLALAASQAQVGRLDPLVRDRALEIIETGVDLRRWEEQPKLRRERERVLAKLRDRLLAPQPARAKIRKPFVEQTEFAAGDVFAYRHATGSTVIFRVIAIYRDYLGATMPIVEPLEWDANELPSERGLERLRPLPNAWREWFSGYPERLILSRQSKTDGPGDRATWIARGVHFRDVFNPDWSGGATTWKRLDDYLAERRALAHQGIRRAPDAASSGRKE